MLRSLSLTVSELIAGSVLIQTELQAPECIQCEVTCIVQIAICFILDNPYRLGENLKNISFINHRWRQLSANQINQSFKSTTKL